MNLRIMVISSATALLSICCLSPLTAQIADMKLIASDGDAGEKCGQSALRSSDYAIAKAMR